MTKNGGSDWYQLAGSACPRSPLSRVPLGEQVEGRAGLLVGHPEDRRGHEQHRHHDQPLPLLGRPLGRPAAARRRSPTVTPSSTHLKLREMRLGIERHRAAGHEQRTDRPIASERHPNRRAEPAGRRAPRPRDRSGVPDAGPSAGRCLPAATGTGPGRRNMPTAAAPNPQCHELSGDEPHRGQQPRNASLCASQPRDQRRDERPGVDAHVVERVPRVPPHVVGRVELAHQRADVGLEQPGADRDQHQARGRRWPATGWPGRCGRA